MVGVHVCFVPYDMANGYVPEPAGATQDDRFYGYQPEYRMAVCRTDLSDPSRAAMLKWLNDKIAGATDAAAKARYQESTEALAGCNPDVTVCEVNQISLTLSCKQQKPPANPGGPNSAG